MTLLRAKLPSPGWYLTGSDPLLISAAAINWPLVFSLQNCNGATRCLSHGPGQRAGGKSREIKDEGESWVSQVADALKMVCAALPAPLDVECEVMITVSRTENTQHSHHLPAGVHRRHHRAHCQPVHGPWRCLQCYRTLPLTSQFISPLTISILLQIQ